MMIGPAVAQQQQPNPNQVAAKALLQAADKAIGASNVKSVSITATGWMAYPGQQFHLADLPRTDLKSYTITTDYASKSQKRRGIAFGKPLTGKPRIAVGRRIDSTASCLGLTGGGESDGGVCSLL